MKPEREAPVTVSGVLPDPHVEAGKEQVVTGREALAVIHTFIKQ